MPYTKEKYKILMIDDDEDDYFILEDIIQELGPQFSIDWCADFSEGWNALMADQHDLYLIDNLLGAENGLDLIRNAQEHGLTKPMILLTGAGNKQLDILALRYGAADYLVKSELSFETLERCIRHALQRYEYGKMIREQQRQFRVFFESSFAPTFILNGDFTIEEVNPAFIEKFGSATSGSSLSQLFESSASAQQVLQKLQRKAIENYSTLLIDKEGSIVEVILNISRYSAEGGEAFQFFGVVHDLTQIRKAEKQLALAEQVNMTGRMARIMAHEIRNPLTNINLAADQLREELEEKGSDEDDLAFVDLIKRNSERINKLITDLLNTTKETKLTKSPYDLKKVVEEACELIRDRIILKKIDLKIDGLVDGLEFPMDAERMRIAILNIFTNAIEAMEDAENRQLHIVLDYEKAKTLNLSICDTGRGMTDDVKRRIFEPFYTGRSGGMGLGMTAVMNILTAHDALIEVTSKVGEGTCFAISFPNP